ncbi:MAG: hypothetical protein V2A65_07090 [Candidatus Omnitrophota bacterium]
MMKKYLTLFMVLSIFIPGSLWAQTKAAKATKPDKEQLQALLRPKIEGMIVKHPSMDVRIWSMALLQNLNKVDDFELVMLPVLIEQLSSKDETSRLVAMQVLRDVIDLDKEQWESIMAPVMVNLTKTSKSPEIKTCAITCLKLLGQLDEKDMKILPLLFDLAQSNDAQVRKTALGSINDILAKKSGGT